MTDPTHVHLLDRRAEQAIARLSAAYTAHGNPSSNGYAVEPAGILASHVQPEQVRFLWSGRLACGKSTMVDGDPGLGKSTMALDIAARISTGRPLLGCAAGSEPRGVVLLSAEDGAADTIVPRLTVAGADLARFYIMRGVKDTESAEAPVTLPASLPAIEAAIEKVDA